tara:strand:- start:19039 stop:19881 length:843 start_codon:yes stop_codon:yes gene_type:complete
MGKKSSTGADVVGAASTEGEFAREIAREGSYADRPDQYNPFGSSTWGQSQVRDPASGEMVTKWTQNQQLNAPSQQLLNSEISNNRDVSSLQSGAMSRARQEMGQPVNFDQFGDVNEQGIAQTTGNEEFTYDSSNRQRAEDAAYGRATSRLDPQFEQKRSELEIRLRNRGLSSGDQQYQSEMENFGRSQNDAYEQARMGSVGEGRAEDQQSFGQAQAAFGTNRGSEQQQFDQGMQSNERANALRQKQIDEYLGKRGQGISEAERLGQLKNYDEVTSAFGGG